MEEAAEETPGLSPEKREEKSLRNETIWCLKRLKTNSGWLRLFDNTEVKLES